MCTFELFVFNDVVEYRRKISSNSPIPDLGPEIIENTVNKAPAGMKDKPSDNRNKRSQSETFIIELTEKEDEAGNIAAEDTNHIDTKPGNKQVRRLLLESRDAKTVAEKKDKEAEHLTKKQGNVVELFFLAFGLISRACVL